MSIYNSVMVTILGMAKGIHYSTYSHSTECPYNFLKDVTRGDYASINHILLIFKRAIYELRPSKAKPSIYFIQQKLKSTYKIEAEIAEASSKLDSHYKKMEKCRFHDLIK